MFAVEIYYSLALWSKIRYVLRIYKKKIRQKLSSLLLFNNFVFVGNTNHISLFPCIYAIIFDYLYQISFILTPKWVYYASILYYIKSVVILSVMQCLLSGLILASCGCYRKSDFHEQTWMRRRRRQPYHHRFNTSNKLNISLSKRTINTLHILW